MSNKVIVAVDMFIKKTLSEVSQRLILNSFFFFSVNLIEFFGKVFFRNFFIFPSKSLMMLVLTVSGSCIRPLYLKDSKRQQHMPNKACWAYFSFGATYHNGRCQASARANFAHFWKTWDYIQGKPKFHLRVKNKKKKYLIFSLFFPQNLT